MSEAMSSGEIDRVLDNIRRLVSLESEGRAQGTDRLVLTSDLRVGEDAVAARPADAGSASRDLPPAFEVVKDRPAARTLEARIAELEAAIGRGDEFEPDGSEAQDQHRPDKIPSFNGFSGGRLHFEAEGTEAGDEATSLEDDDLMAAFDVQEHEVNPVLEEAPEPELRFFHGASRAAPLSGFANRDDPLKIEDTEELIDEDALRDLVAEIVREELAGALGERITRNVRKLVRREVMRVLSARDFE